MTSACLLPPVATQKRAAAYTLGTRPPVENDWAAGHDREHELTKVRFGAAENQWPLFRCELELFKAHSRRLCGRPPLAVATPAMQEFRPLALAECPSAPRAGVGSAGTVKPKL
jgi:hypothetical protein